MNLLQRAGVAGLTVVAATTMAPGPAQAGERYVTRSEFHQVGKNTTIARTHRVFDTAGRQTSFNSAISQRWCNEGDTWACASQSRDYRTRSPYGFVTVYYYRRDGVWRIDSKYAYWG